MDSLVASTKATGGIGVVGVFVPQDPAAESDLANEGKMPFDFGSFWFNGLSILTGQANVKANNRPLAPLIHHDKASPGQIISHRLSLDEAPEGYKNFDSRVPEWTKVLLKP